MGDYTKINIDGHWVSPRGGTAANTINPATGKCGGRMSLPPLPMLTSPACESRDTGSHTFCTASFLASTGKVENLRPICLPSAFSRPDISG
jgi:hypothetical protein